MANQTITSQIVSNELLRRFKNNLGFAKIAHHEDYREHFGQKGAKIGDTLNLRDPVKYGAAEGATLVIQDTTERKIPLVISERNHSAFGFSTSEQTLNIDRVGERYVNSAAVALANIAEVKFLKMAYQNTPNVVGTPGTTPSTFLTYETVTEVLDRNDAPMDGERYIAYTPKMQTSIVDALKALFQSSEQIKRQYIKGRMGTAAGLDWVVAQNIRTHTLGLFNGTPLVNGSNQSGFNSDGRTGSLNLKGFTANSTRVLGAGDVITLTGMYAVNPVSTDALSDLRQFTVLADVNSDSSGNGTALIYPAIVPPGTGAVINPYATVSTLVNDGTAVTLFGTGAVLSPQAIAFHKEAYAWACVPLDMPRAGVVGSRATDPDSGISIRSIEFYDGVNDIIATRCDIAMGYVAPRGEWGCRVAG